MAAIANIGISTADGVGDSHIVGISQMYTIVCLNQGADVTYEGSLDGTNFFPLTSSLTLINQDKPGVEAWTLSGLPVQAMRINVANYSSGSVSALALST